MKTAILVIDVQRGLFDAEPRPFEADVVIERINQLSSYARSVGAPVIFVQHEKTTTALEHGTIGWQLVSNIETGPTDHFVRKTTPDSFLRTELHALLEFLAVRHVVVCGYASEFCVDTTARRAAALGYAVTIAADAHTTHDKDHASASSIRAHENSTLPNITSFGPAIKAVPSREIEVAA